MSLFLQAVLTSVGQMIMQDMLDAEKKTQCQKAKEKVHFLFLVVVVILLLLLLFLLFCHDLKDIDKTYYLSLFNYVYKF